MLVPFWLSSPRTDFRATVSMYSVRFILQARCEVLTYRSDLYDNFAGE